MFLCILHFSLLLLGDKCESFTCGVVKLTIKPQVNVNMPTQINKPDFVDNVKM